MKNHKRKLKRKKKLSRVEKFNLWLESHKLLAFFVDFTVYLVLVGIVCIVFSQVILLPNPYNQINYMSPLYCNIIPRSPLYLVSNNNLSGLFYHTCFNDIVYEIY